MGHLLGVCNSQALRDVYEEAQPLVIELSLKIGQSRAIYDGLKTIQESSAFENYDAAQVRTIEKYVKSAERTGVGLEGADKERFLDIQRETSKLGTEFGNHVLDATKAFELIITDAKETQGWTDTLKAVSSQSYNQSAADHEAREANSEADTGPWRVTLDYPSFGPFMQHSRQRDQREAVMRAFATRAASGDLDNTELVERLLALSAASVKLLDYETYADYSLDAKMAGKAERVYDMYERLDAAARPASVREIAEVQSYANEHGHDGDLSPWDVSFWAERLREERFQYTDEELRPYFPMPRVLDGLFGVCTRLFGVTFAEVVDEPSCWQKDVRYYNVLDESGNPLAGFYLDPYARPAEKRGGAWMDDCLGRRTEPDGAIRLPVAHLICNGTPPTKNRPSLMSFNEVETLFHEFGHGLQHMLTHQSHAAVAGINNVEWDAVELASQFMENWCYDKPVLVGMTQHVDTGESLPDDLFEKICAAKTFMAGYGIMRQMMLGRTDMELYHKYTAGQGTPGIQENAHELALRIARATMPIEPLPEGRTLCSFGHIFAGGYSAGYYSYLWSEVLSADAFAAFEEAGLGDAQAVERLGRLYGQTVLGLGGGEHPMEVFKAFRGREPDPQALLRHRGLLD